MTLGERIESRRKALGIKSQADLARRADVPQGTLNGIINRDYRWSPHLARIARELQTSVAFLTGDTDDPDQNAPPPPQPARTQHVMMPVALPSERALARMFEGLLLAMDRSAPVDEQALLLAKRLPIGLSQLRDLLPVAAKEADRRSLEEAAEPLATPGPERR